ncbi:lytic transglycosylase domain-containing protein [Bosea vestrisii]|uniref:lytic transglycosylase domain-containing protein n=1 Tax=Bosea vestrisii TaxID=151416 RepID=UPI0024DFD2BC|nr:lytic transglycosylase domain-containing protein [Bosea vestrisii]WID99319.1 lytic transglycosylase domain-containing protein [Bosea vestrisii]
MADFCSPDSSRGCGVSRCTALLLLSGLALSIAPSLDVMAHARSPERASARHAFADQIAEASQRFGIPQRWILAVLQAESAGSVRAVSSAGAMGLMQLMPATWAELRDRHRLGRDPFAPRDNLLAGTAYLREMWDRYGTVAAMLAAYNAGPARYDEHRAKGRPLPAEARTYVALLTPALGAERPSKAASLVAPPSDWREATIFVARDDNTSGAAIAPLHRSATDASSPVPSQTNVAARPQPEALFVARNAPALRP